MNDLVRPTALFTSALIPASAPGGVLATVSNPPPPVTQLPAGSTLTGVVVGHDTEGHTLVRTDLGTLAVATKAQLPVNSEVTLHIRSSGGQLHILIMHSEAPPDSAQGATASHSQAQAGAQAGGSGPRNAPTTAPTSAPTAATTPATAQAASIPTSDLLTLGQSVRAVVQSPAATAPAASIQTGPGGITGAGAAQPANPALTALASQLIPGSELQLKIVTVQAPGLQTAPGTPGAAPGTVPGLTSQSAPYTALPGSSGPAAPLSTGQPGAPTTPSGPPSTTAPQAGAPAGPLAPASPHASTSPHTTSQGAAPGPAGAGAPTTPIPGGLSSTAPASGVAASYAAAGGISGVIPIAEARAAVIDMTPKTSALLAAHGIGQAAATSGSRSATTTAGTGPAATPSATPPTTAATNQGATPPTAGGGAGGALQFTGSVTTVSIAGHPVLQTPLGTLSLEIRAALQIGSQITFELSNTTSLPSGLQFGAAMAVPEPTSLSTLAHSWPALDEAFQALHEAGPPVATTAAAIRDAIPQPGTRLASGMLFFLSALSGGDMNRWLGSQALQALKTAGRDGLLARLGQDFEQLGRLADNPGGEWRLFLIPLLDGDQVRQLRLFLRHGQQDGDGDGNDEDEGKTRFVVEVALSSLGDLQLDGLVREKRLDLILRSRAPLPAFMRRDIMQIFHDANEITGYRGSIGFQSSIDWKAIPIEPPDADASPGVMV